MVTSDIDKLRKDPNRMGVRKETYGKSEQK